MKKRRLLISIMAGLLACLMVLTLLLSSMPMRANAASSSEIRAKIKELQSQADAIQAKQDDLQNELDQNTSDTEDIIAQKNAIDQEIQVIHEKVDNNNALIQSYNDLISEKQVDLDDALARQAKLNEEYKVRLRAMEENGKLSYWSILFKANSFLDLLDQINMISEIAARDQAMLEELDAVAQEIQDAQDQLEADKADLEIVKTDLEASQAELDEKRAESDELLKELVEHADELAEKFAELDAQEKEISDAIAAQEQAYNEAREKELEEQRQQEANNNNNSGSSETPPPSNSGNGDATSGFAWPSSCRYITSAYGWRDSPFGNGTSTWHTGIDIGASMGSAIYASKSGRVTTAITSNTGYGNYVVINHGDGSSTLYAHMTNYIVSVGQDVSQGQVIGYVGSTGNSTGPHLHFNIYINGSTVNPLAYLP